MDEPPAPVTGFSLPHPLPPPAVPPPAPGFWGRWRSAPRPKPATFGLAVKENLEAALFAVILVVCIVRHFSLTPFLIPSPSMEPTLLGHEGANDRLFVNRWIYRFAPVARWDVVVFEYPANQANPFVKRVAGLPGEELAIADGDVYADGQIARKDRRAQESLWLEAARLAREEDLRVWDVEGGTAEWAGEGVRIAPSGPAAWLRFGRPPGERPLDPQAPDHFGLYYIRPGSRQVVWASRTAVVGDVRIRARVVPGAGGGRVTLEIVSGQDVFRAEIRTGKSGNSKFVHESRGVLRAERFYDLALPQSSPTDLAFWHADRRVVLAAGGRELVTYDHDLPLSKGRPETRRARVSIGVEGGPVELFRVSVHRDVHYTAEGVLAWRDGQPGSFKIPADHYFMLGDNSPSSSDSRLWAVVRTRLTDGRVIHREAHPGGGRPGTHAPAGPGRVRLLDDHGVWQEVEEARISSEELLGPDPGRGGGWGDPRLNYGGVDPAYQCVRRDLVLGRAFLIFWPPRRVGFIR